MRKNKTIHCTDYVRVIERLVAERNRLGLSQAEVANLTGLSQSDVSKIENFERRLDVLEFKDFLEAYRVNKNEPLKAFVQLFFQVGN